MITVEKLAEHLKKIAKQPIPHVDDGSDWCPYDVAAGHVDDTYWAGVEAGEAGLAQYILREFLGLKDES